MTEDQYVIGVLQKHAVNLSSAQAAANGVAPSIRKWAGNCLSNLEFSGSFAKGTASNLSTDVDIFISLKSDTSENLREIFESLFAWSGRQGWSPRKQNVSIGISNLRMKIDLVPGKVQPGYLNRHSLYKLRTDSWTQTNIKMHIDTVKNSGRVQEIRAIKIWRDLHGLLFPSFCLELMVIEGLKWKRRTYLAANVLHALSFIGDNLTSKRVVDPANTNNVISDDLSAMEKNTVARQAHLSAGAQNWGNIIW